MESPQAGWGPEHGGSRLDERQDFGQRGDPGIQFRGYPRPCTGFGPGPNPAGGRDHRRRRCQHGRHRLRWRGPTPTRASVFCRCRNAVALPQPGMQASQRPKGTGSPSWMLTTNGFPPSSKSRSRRFRRIARPRSSFARPRNSRPRGSRWAILFAAGQLPAGSEAWKALLACNFVATPTVVARRERLLQLGGFGVTLKVAEDQDMWIRLALTGPPTYVPESLVRVHMRPESLSSWRLDDQYAYTLPMIEHHLAALGGRLTRSEARAIMGARLNKIGLTACAHGDLLRGLSITLRSVLLGYRPLRGLGAMTKAPLRVCLRKLRFFNQRGHTVV